MSDEYGRGGMGCGEWLAVLVLLFVGGLFLLAGGDYETTRTTTNANTTPILSGNELLSRNQANIASDVSNTYFDCIGAYSCVTTTTSENTTTTSTATTSNNVDGERNVIYSSQGVMLCQDPNNPNLWTDIACKEGGQP